MLYVKVSKALYGMLKSALWFYKKLKADLEKKGFIVESYSDCKTTTKRITEKNFDFAIVDMRLEDGSGLELIKLIKSINIFL